MPTVNCPYCGSVGSIETANRPGRKTLKCSDCEKHYVQKPNGKVYPLVDPEDPRSQPIRK